MSIKHSKRPLLFISRVAPVPGQSGSQTYACDVLTNLAANGFEVHCLWLDPFVMNRLSPVLRVNFPGTPIHTACPGYFRLGKFFWHPKGILHYFRRTVSRLLKLAGPARPESVPIWGAPLSPQEKEMVERVRRQAGWEVVVCNYCWLADALSLFGSSTRKVILAHDVWHQFPWLSQKENPDLQNLNRQRETYYLNQADVVTAITGRDKAIFQEMVPAKKIVVALMSCLTKFSTQTPVRGRLLFVGSNFVANLNGVNWFLADVGPLLEKQMAGVFELHVVGSVGRGMTDTSNGIKLVKRGVVPDLDLEYAQAQIVVVPILEGTGLKIKLIEAIGHGKPVITTPEGALGVEFLEGRAFVQAASAEEFARAILEVFKNEEKRSALEAGAREAAVNIFSPAACARELLAELT